MRGKADSVRGKTQAVRITPACAGKRKPCSPPSGRCGDHPRVCGEKALFGDSSGSTSGSPPRVRGKASSSSSSTVSRGITPACAGKSPGIKIGLGWSKDHPRVCGEKSLKSSSTYRLQGSPPRVRGKAHVGQSSGRRVGITPACAGKRAPATGSPAPPRDHPRVCGEKARRHPLRQNPVGSPPRVRGKDTYGGEAPERKGITPACAGKRQAFLPLNPW